MLRLYLLKKNNIGITIQNLGDLDAVIENLHPCDYQIWVNNCLRIREKLVQGYYIRQVLSTIS